MLLTLLCSAAWSAASRRACPCTASNARATWPTSSRVLSGTGSTVTSGASPARMLSTACGSRRCATSSAELRSIRSDRVSDARHQHDDRDGEQQAEHEDHGVDAREVARPGLGGVSGGGQGVADVRPGGVDPLRPAGCRRPTGLAVTEIGPGVGSAEDRQLARVALGVGAGGDEVDRRLRGGQGDQVLEL